MKHTVSVIITSYNRSTMLIRALNSVMIQSIPPKEINIVDDGSEPRVYQELESLIEKLSYKDQDIPLETLGLSSELAESPDIETENTKFREPGHKKFNKQTSIIHLKEFRKDGKDSPVIRFVQLEHHGKPSISRNMGVKLSSSQYIAFLDDDDQWFPDKLELQLKILEESKFRWCHAREIWIRNGTVISQRKQKHSVQGDIFQDALHKCIIGPSTVLLERSLFLENQGFDETIRIAEDYELWLRILSKHPIAYVNKAVINKNGGHDDQLSSRFDQIEPFRIQALVKAISVLSKEQGQEGSVIQALKELEKKAINYAEARKKRKDLDSFSKWKAFADHIAHIDPKIIGTHSILKVPSFANLEKNS